jgi:homoisocitrate dehydrogenase
MTHRLCVIEGDGIGKEVIPAAVRVVQTVIPDVQTISAEAGWECFQKRGISVPQSTLDTIRIVVQPCLGRYNLLPIS